LQLHRPAEFIEADARIAAHEEAKLERGGKDITAEYVETKEVSV
jgi:hypothetical protein